MLTSVGNIFTAGIKVKFCIQIIFLQKRILYIILHHLSKYFFAFDLQNYARLTPVYLAQMFELEDHNPKTWAFLQANFSVNKSKVPFSATGVDHALEQENRAMKVMGGIKGIGNKASTMEKHFLDLPETNNIIDCFNEQFGFQRNVRDEHYQLTGGTNYRVINNATRLMDVFTTHKVNFDNDHNVYNILTKAILPEKSADQFLKIEEEGEKLLNDFINERLCGTKSIWEPIKRRKLPTFKENYVTSKVKLADKVITLKEERRLLTRFVMASRERPEVDLPKYLGQYEFSVVPRSMFNSDGIMRIASDKSAIMHEIEKIIGNENVINLPEDSEIERTIMFDGMGLVNRIKKSDNIKTCKDFADVFVKRIMHESRSFQQVNLIFDRYMTSSLKSRTRDKRTKGVATRYKIADDTNIEHVSLKSLLSHVETKRELTEYLGEKVVIACEEIQKRYIVVYETTCKTNTPIEPALYTHEQEEADTLMILYGIEVAHMNPFQELIVCSPDTDVLLLLIFFYQELCTHTIFRTGSGNRIRDINIGLVYEMLGEEKCKALLGFHCFTGCDQTAKFYGKSKLSCWKTFLNSPSQVITAFNELGDGAIVSTSVRNGLTLYLLDLYNKSRPDTSLIFQSYVGTSTPKIKLSLSNFPRHLQHSNSKSSAVII